MKWRPLFIGLLVVLGLTVFLGMFTEAVDSNVGPPAWSSPSVMALKKVSPVSGAQHESTSLNNLDCSLVDYRLVGDSTMRNGCFTETAFGLMDTDTQTVIFNGTDEGLPLLPYGLQQFLAPWPKSADLLAMTPQNTGGTYLSLYKNILNVMQDQRSLIGQLTAKQLTAAPDLLLKSPDGQPLVINSQTPAFSSNGSWLVAETVTGAFVRVNLSTLSMVAFAPSFGSTGSPALLRSQVAVSDDGHFVAIANAAAGTFKVYDLTTCGPGTPDLQPTGCRSYNYQPFVQQQINGLQMIRHVRFVNNGLLSFEAQTSDTNSGGIYELAPTDAIHSLIDYLGMGDSYTSGEGAFDYLSGSATADDSCHLSTKSYPLMLTRDLFSPLGGHSVACSGAVIRDVGSTSDTYRGQAKNVLDFARLTQEQPALLNSVMANFLPGYVAQQRFVGQYQPGVMTVSVGGDDIGFGDIVRNCAEPHLSLHLSDGICYNTYEDRVELTNLVDRTVPRWTALYRQLRATAPESHLYAVGYPSIAADSGDCGLNVHLSKSELELAEEMVVYLNGGIAKAAADAGVTYVDISQALVGHRLCETASYNVAVNGLTAGDDIGPLGTKLFGKESYHPNALGQELIEQAILRKTRNLTTAPSPSVPATTNLLNAPKTGRVVQVKVPDGHLAPSVAKRGSVVSIRANGASDGLKPNTAYTVRLGGSAGSIIGSVVSDDSGDINGTVSVPVGSSSGGHTIDVTGENQAGEPVDVTQPIYVPASDTDSDGDGIPDASDSCPGAVNSGADADQDGIDDVCDNLIGQPPTDGTGNGSGTGEQINITGIDGVVLPIQPVTLVASFEIANTDSSRGAPTNSAARVLGAVTVSPSSTDIIKPPMRNIPVARIKPTGQWRQFGRLPIIGWLGWLRWALLPVICWLILIVLSALNSWLLNRRRCCTIRS